MGERGIYIDEVRKFTTLRVAARCLDNGVDGAETVF